MLQLAICHLPTFFGPNPDRAAIEQHAAVLPRVFRAPLLARTYMPAITQSLGGMLLLRYLLGEEQFDAIAPLIEQDKNGRPHLPDGSLDFNISHCEEYAVCVLETDIDRPRVGIDIQALPATRNTDKIARRFFTHNEYEYYSAHYDRELAFLRIWTRKEALVKWKGTVLGANIRRLDSLLAPDTEQVMFDEYIIGDRYMMTVCHRKNSPAPRQNEFRWM